LGAPAATLRGRVLHAFAAAALLSGFGGTAFAQAQRAAPPTAAPTAPETPANAEPEPAPAATPDGRATDAPPRAPLDTWGLDEPQPELGSNPEPSAATPAEPRRPVEEPRIRDDNVTATGSERGRDVGQRRLDASTVRYTLEAIEVRGNTRTSTRVILRYIPFKPGNVLDVDDPAVELARFRLLGTGFFRDVQFSLRKGSERGFVILSIDVVQRNTIVVNDIWMGLSADADVHGKPRKLSAYAGLDVAETNLGGTGITLGTAAAVAEDQKALLRVRFLDPAFLGGPWMTSGVLLFNDARDYFGNADVRWADRGSPEATGPAVVRYTRFGGSLGLGRDLSISTQLWTSYRLESIEASYPVQASHLRGFAREPIDFHVVRGHSVLSTISGTLQHDTRDHPFLPTRGWFVSVHGELSLLPAALDYDYQRFELDASYWWKLPFHDHVLRLEVYGGAISGNAPFFERFYVGDLSDFLPDRILGASFDRRPPPNFLGTDVVEVRYGDFAFKLSGEYRIPLYRGHRSIYGIDAFAAFGVYGIASKRGITDPPIGYSGLARVPIDLTGNFGLRMDTNAGGFAFAFSNVLSFIPVRGEGPAGAK
jgi:outer membrane protein assembly factor BamA